MSAVVRLLSAIGRAFRCLLRPTHSGVVLATGAARDITRTRSELPAENASLPQQIIIMRRSIARPRRYWHDRVLMLVLARLDRRWRDATHVVSLETLLRWHRDLCKIVWRRKSRPKSGSRRLAPDTIALIQTMTADNVLWGAERIRGELLKLGARVSKRTIQKYMSTVRPPGKRGQT